MVKHIVEHMLMLIVGMVVLIVADKLVLTFSALAPTTLYILPMVLLELMEYNQLDLKNK